MKRRLAEQLSTNFCVSVLVQPAHTRMTTYKCACNLLMLLVRFASWLTIIVNKGSGAAEVPSYPVPGRICGPSSLQTLNTET